MIAFLLPTPQSLLRLLTTQGQGEFDWVIHSPLGVPLIERWRFSSLAAMLHPESPEQDGLSAAGGGRPQRAIGDNPGRPSTGSYPRLCLVPTTRVLCRGLHTPGAFAAQLRGASGNRCGGPDGPGGLRVVLPMSFDRPNLGQHGQSDALPGDALVFLRGNGGVSRASSPSRRHVSLGGRGIEVDALFPRRAAKLARAISNRGVGRLEPSRNRPQ